MTERWGRADSAGTWPHATPIWSIGAVLVAFAVGVSLITYEYAFIWTPLQRFYLGPYVRSAVLATLRVNTDGRYRLLSVIDHRGTRMALESEVRPVTVGSGRHTVCPQRRRRAARRSTAHLTGQDVCPCRLP